MKNTTALTSDQSALLWRSINHGTALKLLPAYHYDRRNFLSRSRHAMVRNLASPGDCASDLAMLAALAVAQAQVGVSPGWIPETQRIAYTIVSTPGF